MDNIVLKRLQYTELAILSDIDNYCKAWGVVYSLSSGTALGAVRHKGFIPWDDDIDITMTRYEYNKFCMAWKKAPMPGYYLESLLTDDQCAISHAKVRKDNTILLSEGADEGKPHQGIWVDIFPLDKYDAITEKKVLSKGRRIIVLSRANDKVQDKFWKRIVRGIIRLIPKKVRMTVIQRDLSWLTNNDLRLKDNYKYVYLMATYTFKYRFPKELPEETTEIEFEGRKFPIYADYDTMLKINYGDYMKLPPVEERVCKHNPVKIVFDDEKSEIE